MGRGESDGKHNEVEIAKWTVHGFAIIGHNSIVCAMLHKHTMNVEDTDNKVLNEMR